MVLSIAANRCERQEFLHIETPSGLLFPFNTILFDKDDYVGNGTQGMTNYLTKQKCIPSHSGASALGADRMPEGDVKSINYPVIAILPNPFMPIVWVLSAGEGVNGTAIILVCNISNKITSLISSIGAIYFDPVLPCAESKQSKRLFVFFTFRVKLPIVKGVRNPSLVGSTQA